MVNVFANPPYILQTRKLQLLQLLLQLQRNLPLSQASAVWATWATRASWTCPPGIQSECSFTQYVLKSAIFTQFADRCQWKKAQIV